MNKIIFTLLTCKILSVDFAEPTVELNSIPDEPKRIICEKIKDAYKQYGCFNEFGVSEIFTMVVNSDKDDLMLVNKTTNKVYHWVGARAAFHNRSMVREGSTEQFCVGRVETQ